VPPCKSDKQPDPVHDSSQQRRLARAAQQLADLLTEAIPLAEVLNAPKTPHKYRTMLRELVGPEQYFELTNTLRQMCSMRGWQMAHAKDAAELERLRRPVGS
jgi:hypothetical protein